MLRSLVSITPAARRGGLVGSVVAGVAALALAFGAPAAQAAPTVHVSTGHVDVVRVGIDLAANKFVVGLNHESAGTYYGASQVQASPAQEPGVDLVVTKKIGNSWVISETETASDLFAGFAGSGIDAPEGAGLGAKLSNGDHVAFEVTPNAANPGTAALDFPATAGVVSQGNVHTATVKDVAAAEAFHAHPRWTFSAAGAYYLTVKVSNPEGKVGASDPLTYKIVVG